MKSTLFISEIKLRSVQHGKDGIATHVSEEITWDESSEGTLKQFVSQLREEGETVEVIEARGSLVDENGDTEDRKLLYFAYGQIFSPISVEQFTAKMKNSYELDANSELV